jgi:predicted DNA-binding transcriptional regulator YafY
MKQTKQEQYNILIEEFQKQKNRTLDIYDETLKERLGKSPKTIQRIIEDFMLTYNSVVELEGERRKTYKLITPMDIIVESYEHFEELGWLFSMAHDADPKVFGELEKYTKKDKHIYKFKNSPFEDINTIESKQSFQRLKRMIEAREYVKIKFSTNEEAFDNLKCLKLIFMDNNWYVAYVDAQNRVRLGRISFIQRVDYGTKVGHFQPSSVQEHLQFLENIQNSSTLYGEKAKLATIKATPNIARYFDEGMKTFLSSQKFIKKEPDGSVIFSLEYTQPLEILPLIQKWLPDLIILEPKKLQEAYVVKLQKTISNQT